MVIHLDHAVAMAQLHTEGWERERFIDQFDPSSAAALRKALGLGIGPTKGPKHPDNMRTAPNRS